jgi:hypothetical protein
MFYNSMFIVRSHRVTIGLVNCQHHEISGQLMSKDLEFFNAWPQACSTLLITVFYHERSLLLHIMLHKIMYSG